MNEKEEDDYVTRYSNWKEERGIKIKDRDVKPTNELSQKERFDALPKEEKLKILGFDYRMSIAMSQLEKDHPLFKKVKT